MMVDGSIVKDDDDGCQPEPQDIGDDLGPPRCQEGGALSGLDDLSMIQVMIIDVFIQETLCIILFSAI